MHDYAIDLGVPAEAIVRDYAGRSTYDTCYRAKAIFGVSEAILVTQQFHLPRALYTCKVLGIEVAGVAAYESRYWRGAMTFWSIREIGATAFAFWDVYISHPLPVLGDPEPIVSQ
jgi:vancomycin permeability regulator SanA